MGTYRLAVKDLERDFHESFINAYANEQVSVTYARLTQKMYLIRLHNLEAVGPANTIQSMREHLAVIDALEKGDTEGAIEALDRHCRNKDLLFAALLVTDINTQNSVLMACGAPTFLQRINFPAHGPHIWELPGVVSRKKQLLPYLLQCLAGVSSP